MLSSRLQTIASMINSGSIVADIGTDHALLPIYLVQNSISPKVYAVDNKKGPLERAKQAVSLADLEQSVIPMLSSGLKDISHDVNVVVIAGMGVETATEILLSAKSCWHQFDQIVLQLNGDQYQLRQFLMSNQFEILDEQTALDQYISFILSVVHVSHPVSYSQQQLMFGPILLQRKDELLMKFIGEQLAKKEQLLQVVPCDSHRFHQLKEEIQLYQNVLTGC